MTLAANHELLEPTNVTRTRDALLSAHHLDGSFYTSPEVQALEKERIFLKEWLFLAREEELPNPGDYLARRIAGEPVVIVRNENGEIGAFANVCRHRGVEVAKLGSGNATSFMCPYHAWTYGLDGKLISAPGMKDSDVDLSNCRLPVLKSETWRGCIFVTLNPEPEPFSEVAAGLESKFGFAQYENCRIGHKFLVDLRCNWKFAHENLMDLYHADTIHLDTFAKNYKSELDYDQYNYAPDGGFSFQWEALPLTKDGETLIGPMPWFEGQPSLAYAGGQFPNIIVTSRCDIAMFWVAWPVTPDTCQFAVYTLVAEDVLNRPEFDTWVSEHDAFQNAIVDEDREMVESLQNGARSRTFVPGVMAKAEGPIHHFLNAYLDKIQGPAAL